MQRPLLTGNLCGDVVRSRCSSIPKPRMPHLRRSIQRHFSELLVVSNRDAMSTPLSKSRAVSLAYAILATMYLGIFAILANALWRGSLRELWIDLRQNVSDTILPMSGLFAIHAIMSALCFNYSNRRAIWRLAILGVALLLMGVASYRALSMLMVWLRGPWRYPIPQLIVPASFLLATGYGLCVWILWRIHMTANRRIEHTREA